MALRYSKETARGLAFANVESINAPATQAPAWQLRPV
jgi:hypothetical protein